MKKLTKPKQQIRVARKIVKWGLLCLFFTIFFAISSFFTLDALFPPKLSRYQDRSSMVLAKDGKLLRAFLSSDDKWRFLSDYESMPNYYWQMLINYEDKRYYKHFGVDPIAILRAIKQNIASKKVVSGASTITMQVAKLLETRPRNLKSKIIELFRAVQLEYHFDKKEVLDMYASLAPMGANREGVEAASRLYFNKSSDTLTISEAAWLVALPKNPISYSKSSKRATHARDKVLGQAVENGIISKKDYEEAKAEKLRLKRYKMPFLAPHYTRELYRKNKELAKEDKRKEKREVLDYIHSDIDINLQKQMESILSNSVENTMDEINFAAMVIDNKDGKIKAWAGGADFFNEDRLGQIDMLKAIRSPGSALKPFIFLYAFSWYNYQPSTIISDTPTILGDYQVKNYDRSYQGDITLEQSLRQSLNIPAIKLLDKISPDSFANGLKKAGLKIYLPDDKDGGKSYGLPIALGGLGVTAESMIELYRELALCSYNEKSRLMTKEQADFLACWQVRRILQRAGDGSGRIYYGEEPVAFKTGTSYGWRDRWVLAFTKDYSLLVWSGRPDGGYPDNKSGSESVVPILRKIVSTLPKPPAYWQDSPPDNLLIMQANKQLPRAIRYFDRGERASNDFALLSPIKSSEIEAEYDYSGRRLPIKISVRGGELPITWVINDKEVTQSLTRYIQYQPESSGRLKVDITDNAGKSLKLNLYIKEPSAEKYRNAKIVLDE